MERNKSCQHAYYNGVYENLVYFYIIFVNWTNRRKWTLDLPCRKLETTGMQLLRRKTAKPTPEGAKKNSGRYQSLDFCKLQNTREMRVIGVLVNIFIVPINTIRLSADALIASADRIRLSADRIRKFFSSFITLITRRFLVRSTPKTCPTTSWFLPILPAWHPLSSLGWASSESLCKLPF